MTTTTKTLPAGVSATRRTPRPARRAGYAIAAAINLGLVWLAVVEPGWRTLTFLTEETTAVLGLLLVAWLIGAAVNVVYLVWDPPGVKHIGDAITSGWTCAVALKLLEVFPFALPEPALETVLRIALIVVAFGTAVAVVVNIVQLLIRPWGAAAP